MIKIEETKNKKHFYLCLLTEEIEKEWLGLNGFVEDHQSGDWVRNGHCTILFKKGFFGEGSVTTIETQNALRAKFMNSDEFRNATIVMKLEDVTCSDSG